MLSNPLISTPNHPLGMKSKSKSFATLLGGSLFLTLVLANPSTAATVFIGEAGFEGAPGRGAVTLSPWKRSSNGSNTVGIESYSTLGSSLDSIPGGGTYLHYNNGASESIYQVLSETLAANTTYTINIQAIDRNNLTFKSSMIRLGYVSGTDDGSTGDMIANDFYGENLLTANSVFNSIPVNGAAADDGWEDWTYTFVTGATPTGLGQQLRVEIVGSGVQSLFDNISMTATAVPEPSTIALLLGSAGALLLRRRRTHN